MSREAHIALAADWRRLVAEIGIPAAGPLLVVGPTDGVARALHAAGIPVTLSLQSGEVHGDTDHEPVVGVPTNVGLVDNAVAGVLALAAWTGSGQIRAVVDEAIRITRPGGMVVLGDVDGEMLTEGPPLAFPASRFYRAHPEAAAAVTSRSVSLAALSMEAVRARLDAVGAMTADRLIGWFSTPADYSNAVANGLWRGADVVDQAAGNATVDAIVSGMRPPFEDRQPWRFVRGTVQ